MATTAAAAGAVATVSGTMTTTDTSDSCRFTTTSAHVDVDGLAITSKSGCGSSTTVEIVGDDQRTSSSTSVVAGLSSEGDTVVTTIPDLNPTTATNTMTTQVATTVNRKLLFCRRFKDSGGILKNFSSLPLFIYATSNSTHTASADGIGVGREAAAILGVLNDSYELALCTINTNEEGGAIECLPLSSANNNPSGNTLHHPMTTSIATGAANAAAVVGGTPYQHHLNLNHHHHHLLAHHSPYSNNYHLHHSGSHQHIHTEQTKSLQELQNEVGALLEFRDLVIETFPDLKHKMASMSSSSPSSAAANGGSAAASVSGANTLTSNVIMSNSSMTSRREWEPGIRIKRKLSQKEPSTSVAANGANSAVPAAAAGELSSSSLSRSRSNSHSGKKEPKSGENNNGSVVQDSGFSTETSSSKDGHSASSTNGAMTGPNASNRLSCPESDDELLNLLDVIHRKSNRLREEVEQLQNYERQNLRCTSSTSGNAEDAADGVRKTESSNNSDGGTVTTGGLTPKTFREHVERLNKEDIKQLRKERDRLLDKLAEMEAETLTGRIKAAKMNDQVEELISVKKDLEEQLKLAMAQKLELSSRVQQLQLQQQQQQNSKSSSSQSDYSSQRLNFLSSATTILSTGSGRTPLQSSPSTGIVPSSSGNRSSGVSGVNQQPNTFQPVVIEQNSAVVSEATKNFLAFHQSASSDSRQLQLPLGRLDGIVSTPGGRNSKCRVTDAKRFQAILLETNVIELQRHLLTLTVQNQVLMQKLDSAAKSKTHLVKRLDKSKDDVEDLRFQLEEKNIELEGTKAQLRVLESRMHSSTPSTGTSYTHSQNDYETNRSSASTTLMLSRRGGPIDSHVSDSRSVTPISATMFPPPTSTQISTPSMKAMIHLPMDEIQQHSSSTESAHDLQNELPQSINKLMSTSVGGTSPFAQHNTSRQQNMKRLGAAAMAVSKPSKIPLPGSKAALYFSGKPPTGRPLTAGRSPSSTNTSTGSNASSKSSLSRSTGNLLYGKSPNSLKRADSAQSIRKEASSSLSTNTSRSSTSSIPMATTSYSSKANVGYTTAITPSSRVLQNSPLPKLKRDSLTSRVRHLDSLSRIYQQQQHQQQNSNDSNFSSSGGCGSNNTNSNMTSTCMSPTSNGGGSGVGYLVASTPKTSISAQLRKDMQLSNNSSSFSHGSQFLRRAAGGNANRTESVGTTAAAATTRRFSSASVVGARIAGRMHAHDNVGNGANNGGGISNSSTSGVVNNTSEHHNANSVDTDSGKKLSFFDYENNKFAELSKTCSKSKNIVGNNMAAYPYKCNNPQLHDDLNLKNFDYARQNDIKDIKLNSNLQQGYRNSYFNMKNQSISKNREQYIDNNISDNSNGEFEISNAGFSDALWSENFLGHCSFNSYGEEDEYGSDNFFVTFDYGYSDSIEEQSTAELYEKFKDDNYDEHDSTDNYDGDGYATDYDALTHEDDTSASYNQDANVWFCAPEVKDDEAAFQVHHMKHNVENNETLLKEKAETINKYNALGNRYQNNQRYKYDGDFIIEETEDEDDSDDEQYFYDSLECI